MQDLLSNRNRADIKSSDTGTEPLTFYGLNRDAQYIVDYSYGLFDPKEAYIEVLDKGRVIYRYGDPGIYNSSAIVGLLDVNPELVGIVYQSNETNVYEGRRRTDNHNYVYFLPKRVLAVIMTC